MLDNYSVSRLAFLMVPLTASMVLGSLQCNEALESKRATKVKEVQPKSDPFLFQLHQRFGKKVYSRHNEDLFIRDFFNDREAGFFVDIGSYDYKKNSNTYYLEKHLNWRGIAVDAQAEFKKGYDEHRPNTKFFSYYISDQSDDQVDFYITENNTQASGIKTSVEKKKHEVIKVPTITLNDLLRKEQVTRINFLNMDIELSEPAALDGFDIQRYRPTLVCIETHHKEVTKQIYDYFRKSNYKELRQYSIRDPFNSYFTPRDMDQ